MEKTPFVLSDVTPNYAVALFERLRAVCHMTTKELKHNGSDALRCHTIDWGGTTEKGGFGHLNAYLREQIVPYQFSISSGEHGRVHGFFAQEVFYVVWLDLNHKLYS